jgi:CheY-like chemotaxis protein
MLVKNPCRQFCLAPSSNEYLLTGGQSAQDERSAKRHGSDFNSESLTSGNKMQNLFEEADVCELCEEVVEGTVAGKAHLCATIGGHIGKSSGPVQTTGSAAGKSVYGFTKNVAVILEFDYQMDWVYVVQPGALRRILMNILGNSLKYTQAGCIRVKLGVRDAATPGGNAPDVVTLSVSDTGKGISKDFLRKRLFTPFNQEDRLSTGCGLGLSIVKSLTASLNGTIEVRSEQGVGTTVSIDLPLSRGPRRSTPKEITLVRQRWIDPILSLPSPGTAVGYVGFILPGALNEANIGPRESKIKESIKASVSSCMVDWLQMQPIGEQADINDADYVVILVDERLSNFIQPYVDDVEKKQPRLIALLPSEMSRREVESALGKSIRAFEVVSAPFGPRKMARAVAACEQTAHHWSQSRRSPIPSNIAPLRQVSADMVIGSELLQAEGLAQNATNHYETATSDSAEVPSLSLVPRPQTLTAGQCSGSFETTIPPRTMMNEPQNSSSQPDGLHGASPREEPVSKPKKSRILLVDDNLINLRFLETYIKKRRPSCDYDCAEDGLQAVKAAEHCESGYSLVFMDLSMPVMDGLEATRKIRALEKDRNTRLGAAAPAAALIVALTGLASSRDQANAFASGVDLFMTKPVKFKEIGKLLDERIKA